MSTKLQNALMELRSLRKEVAAFNIAIRKQPVVIQNEIHQAYWTAIEKLSTDQDGERGET